MSSGDLPLDSELLIDGDDDLLDYFLGTEGSGGPLDMDLKLPVHMDEVNNGMASLLRSPKPSSPSAPFTSTSPTTSPMLPPYVPPSASSPGMTPYPPSLSLSTSSLGPQHSESIPEYWNQNGIAPMGYMASPESMRMNQPPAVAAGKASGRGRGRGRGRGGRSSDKESKKSKAKTVSIKSEGPNTGNPKGMVELNSPAGLVGGVGVDIASHLEDTEEKRQRRLARNRESARQSRRRKKEQLELLEERVSQLTQELDALRRAHLEDSNQTIQLKRRNMLSELTSQGLSGPALKDSVLKIVEQTGPASAERLALLEHHFKHIFNLLLPPYTKFMLWMMNQGDSFFEERVMDPSAGKKVDAGLWALVSNELGLSADQQDKLRLKYKQTDTQEAKDERYRLSHCVNYLAKLRSNISTRSKTVETQSRAILDVLTPEQGLKYLQWVEQNRTALDECGIGESMIFDTPAGRGMGSLAEPKYEAARQVLRKPESEMTLEDLRVLLDVLDGS